MKLFYHYSVKSLFIPLGGPFFSQFATDSGHILRHGLMNFIPEFFIGYFKNPGHHYKVKIQDQISNENDIVTDLPDTGAGYLPSVCNYVIDRLVLGRYSDALIRIYNRLQECSIKGLFSHRHYRVGFGQD